ncbi:L,D-transpeptidase family protein [Microbacterium thalassium]|uniref:L,D-transpeptidase family protein n=1 Tax=Microbacterium TaxID=33882 RepID=UPI00146F81D8|nr:L,D-transpeptidase family protein [Microbacterium thalassium]
MTELATKTTDGLQPNDGAPEGPTYAWAPAEPRPRKSRKGLWIGVGAGAAAVALTASSLVLVAPGTSVAGVGVGFMTPGAATDAVNAQLATTTVVLTGQGADAEVTAADLGATVDARALVDAAFAEHPMWNVTAWFPASITAPITLDEEAASAALRDAAPQLYTDPVDATLAFDAETTSYVATPAEEGTGVDLDAVRAALQDAFEAGRTRVEVEATAAPVQADTPTYVAEATAERLNTMLDTAGFYVGEERTVPVSRAVAASWLTVTPSDNGTFAITADEAAIAELVPTLAKAVNREPVSARVVTDSGGEVLRELTPGVTGRVLGDTGDVASEFAALLATGSGRYELPVKETPFATAAVERRVEVDLGTQTLFMFENDKVMRSFPISSGLSETPTQQGHFRVFAFVPIQDMGCFPGAPYCTADIPWVAYFNGDQAFHGAYWHNNFGNPMSHGCVNMPISTAKALYDWLEVGTEVWIHA